MIPFEPTVTRFITISADTLTPSRPFIPQVPRIHESVVYVLEGTLCYTRVKNSRERTTWQVPPDSILVVTSGEIDISYTEDPCTRYLYIDFEAEDMPTLSPEGLDRVHFPENPTAYRRLFEQALTVWQSREFGCKPQCLAILYTLLHKLAAENYRRTGSYYKHSQIRPAIVRLEQDLTAPPTVAELAALCDMSEANLTRLFAEVTGRTPMEYLTDVRMEEARRLLSQSVYSVGEVAYRCGYGSIYSFSRAFKRCHGVSPSGYR